MATFSVIDTTDGGDTGYQGFVKDAANWAVAESDLARTTHTHGGSGVIITIVPDASSLGTGATDGEMKICADNGDRYIWEATGAKWRVMDGNKYTTASLPTSGSYNIPTGTVVYDTTVGKHKKWDGSSFVNAFLANDELYESFLL